ncbi:hypothetical protein Pan258_21420 [Symmachiella dynata]|nr:hypothetical protein Pan258_21420 [Symmachiella dynata]
MLLAAVVVAVAARWYAFIDSAEGAWLKIEWLMLTLIAEILLFVSVYLYTFLRTPYLLICDLESELRNNVETLQSKQLETAESVAELQENLARAKNADPKKAVICSELKDRLEGFERILEGLESHNVSSIEAFYDLDYPTSEYVRNNISGYTRYGKKFPPRNTHIKNATYSDSDFDNYSEQCQNRIEIMNELVEMYS